MSPLYQPGWHHLCGWPPSERPRDRFLRMTSSPHSERRRHLKNTDTNTDTPRNTHRQSREHAPVSRHVCVCIRVCVKGPVIWHLVKPIPLPKKQSCSLIVFQNPASEIWLPSGLWEVQRKKNLEGFTLVLFVYSFSSRRCRCPLSKIKLNKKWGNFNFCPSLLFGADGWVCCTQSSGDCKENSKSYLLLVPIKAVRVKVSPAIPPTHIPVVIIAAA